MKLSFVCLVLAVVCATVLAAPEQDRVTSLPGWPSALPTKHYSGYVTVGGEKKDKHLHYYYVESENDPANDPVVLWLQGGPGGSSLYGAFTENGPFNLDDSSLAQNISGVPRLYQREYRWNRIANMIFLESPANVGYSYCDNESDCYSSDNSTANNNLEALVGFFAKFPELKNNEFYITGESYAGIYIPMLANAIRLSPESGINLKGVAIGDGCIGLEVGGCAPNDGFEIDLEFLYGHNMISPPLYADILKTCQGKYYPATPDCQKLLNEWQNNMGPYDVYNVYDMCGSDPSLNRLSPYTVTDKGVVRTRWASNVVSSEATDVWKATRNLLDLGGALNDYPCGGESALEVYVQNEKVKEAMHVVNAKHPQFNYTGTVGNLLPVYADLIADYRVWIYSGDVDSCVPIVGTLKWTAEIATPYDTAQKWHPWTIQSPDPRGGSILAGYQVSYDSPKDDFRVTSIHGSGHMAPTFRPAASFAMFSAFLQNKAL